MVKVGPRSVGNSRSCVCLLLLGLQETARSADDSAVASGSSAFDAGEATQVLGEVFALLGAGRRPGQVRGLLVIDARGSPEVPGFDWPRLRRGGRGAEAHDRRPNAASQPDPRGCRRRRFASSDVHRHALQGQLFQLVGRGPEPRGERRRPHEIVGGTKRRVGRGHEKAQTFRTSSLLHRAWERRLRGCWPVAQDRQRDGVGRPLLVPGRQARGNGPQAQARVQETRRPCPQRCRSGIHGPRIQQVREVLSHLHRPSTGGPSAARGILRHLRPLPAADDGGHALDGLSSGARGGPGLLEARTEERCEAERGHQRWIPYPDGLRSWFGRRSCALLRLHSAVVQAAQRGHVRSRIPLPRHGPLGECPQRSRGRGPIAGHARRERPHICTLRRALLRLAHHWLDAQDESQLDGLRYADGARSVPSNEVRVSLQSSAWHHNDALRGIDPLLRLQGVVYSEFALPKFLLGAKYYVA
mmetsp:Transcript_61250/g.134124  ORF Transcript_61250/g.134124 Transcript_61250/m.134124 type:complete len:471 (+) Transcript_61250:372-1784(+)